MEACSFIQFSVFGFPLVPQAFSLCRRRLKPAATFYNPHCLDWLRNAKILSETATPTMRKVRAFRPFFLKPSEIRADF
jgi:hypothetical protein